MVAEQQGAPLPALHSWEKQHLCSAQQGNAEELLPLCRDDWRRDAKKSDGVYGAGLEVQISISTQGTDSDLHPQLGLPNESSELLLFLIGIFTLLYVHFGLQVSFWNQSTTVISYFSADRKCMF